MQNRSSLSNSSKIAHMISASYNIYIYYHKGLTKLGAMRKSRES